MRLMQGFSGKIQKNQNHLVHRSAARAAMIWGLALNMNAAKR